jgi:membrane protein YdbS with pleckstrin-like domain
VTVAQEDVRCCVIVVIIIIVIVVVIIIVVVHNAARCRRYRQCDYAIDKRLLFCFVFLGD